MRRRARCIIAERSLLSALQGGCQVPIGAWARIERGEMVLEASVTSVDGLQHVKQRLTGTLMKLPQMGAKMAQMLIGIGCAKRFWRKWAASVDRVAILPCQKTCCLLRGLHGNSVELVEKLTKAGPLQFRCRW